MIRKLILGVLVLVGFVFASVSVSLIQMAVGALVPGASEDKPGVLVPSPEEKTKQAWEESQKAAKAETESQQSQLASTETQPAETPAPAPAVVEAPVAPPRPVVSRTGPGDFDAPVFVPPPAAPTGPGNF